MLAQGKVTRYCESDQSNPVVFCSKNLQFIFDWARKSLLSYVPSGPSRLTCLFALRVLIFSRLTYAPSNLIKSPIQGTLTMF